MTGIFRDGFDSYASSGTGVSFATKWTSVNGTFSLTTGRFSGRCITGGNTAMSALMDSAVGSLTFHGGVKFDLSDRSFGVVRFKSTTTYMVGFRAQADGSIAAFRETGLNAGTELGRSAAGVVNSSSWYSVTAEIVISDTVGRVTICIDGAQVLNLTSVDTRNGSPTTVDTIQIGDGVSNFFVDDVYVIDVATKLTAHPRIETLYPNSDGATLNFTPSTGSDHFAVVDEAQASSSDYLSGSNVGDLDLLGLGNLSSSPASIEEVCIVGYLQKTDATARSMALGVKSGATTSDGSNFNLNSSGLRHERPLATDPNTSAAWAAAAVDALQLQPKVTV